MELSFLRSTPISTRSPARVGHAVRDNALEFVGAKSNVKQPDWMVRVKEDDTRPSFFNRATESS